MARPVYKYQLFAEPTSTAVGITLPFNKGGVARNERTDISDYSDARINGPSVFNLSYSTREQAISNFKNLLLTIKGERFMQPEFGTNLQKFIFEQDLNELYTRIADEIASATEFWLPYIKITDINVQRSTTREYGINVSISFAVQEGGGNLTINVLADENTIVLSSVEDGLDSRYQLSAIKQRGRF